MSSSSSRKILLVLFGIGVLALAIIYLPKWLLKPGKAEGINPAFAEYISSYTAGIVSGDGRIRIVLVTEAVDSVAIGQEATAKLFDFNPSIGGRAVWLDRRTVEFQPDKRLPSGQVYEVAFFLSRLMKVVPEDIQTFRYSFQVIPQNFELQVGNVRPVSKSDFTRQQVEGMILTADFAEESAVEKMLVAQQEGKALPVRWTHTAEGKQHQFSIDNVIRLEKQSTVEIRAEGTTLGVDARSEKQVTVPALGDFKVTGAFVEQGNTQHVVIQFSDPLNEAQALDGLISLSDLQDLDFEVKDNEVRVYPPVRQSGVRTLTVEAGIRNALDFKMPEGTSLDVTFEQLNPAVRFTGKGNILPASDALVLPFEAVNLKAVDVQVIKIFESNVLQFFQVNDLEGNQELRRVGLPVMAKKISLENAGVIDLGKWNRFTLDLSTLMNTEPGAIYQVRIGFKRAYTAFVCDDNTAPAEDQQTFEEGSWESAANETSYWDSYESYYYGDDYDWQQRDNPCHSSYYTSERTIRRNVLASNLGLIAKRGGDKQTIITVTDIRSAQAVGGAEVELYDYQQQLLGKATTSSSGQTSITTERTPFMLVARSGVQRGYLKLADGDALSLSNFDVGGERVNKGIKGFLYGERGVWRPGDSLYLTFVMEDKMKLLPQGHPLVFELSNPQGQITSRIVKSKSESAFYSFKTTTSADANTGNWQAKVKVGSTEFIQPIRIETVKPNRLKINLDFGVNKITAGDGNLSGQLKINWLHGAPGRNLRAEFEVLLTKAETKFERYPDFSFDDPSIEFKSETRPVFDGYVDALGQATINTTLSVEGRVPGKLNAIFRGKAFEESGNFSVDQFSIPFYPYTSFTGIRLPKGDQARRMLLTDTTHRVDVVTVDADGKPVAREGVQMSLYKIDWRWWWDNNEEGGVNYMSGSYQQPLANGTIKTTNGKGVWTFRVKYPEWGRFLVKAYDPVSGHSSAKVVYIDWPGWAGRARGEADGATMLTFSSDKAGYQVGEQANLVIPGSGNGRALISIENGSRVISSAWLDTKQGDNRYSFPITAEMTPNVFVNITLLQPHGQTVNDLPIRLYGVIPLSVEDLSSRLNPVITMPDVLEPGQTVTIKVSEAKNRRMTYTLAVVDEGLLDLTRFKTPDLWTKFYAREALGVKTWDLFDQVIGAFGGRLEHLLAIGGSDLLASKEDDAKANRFKPVVKFFGPFTVEGKEGVHQFTMPSYIGSVKTMLVAGYDGAYGKAEKVTPVRKPLMVLATLPRVLGPEEKVKLPVTLFATEKALSNVRVDVKVTGPVAMPAGATQTVNVNGDLTIDFDLVTKSAIGKARVEVTATSGKLSATDVIEIDIRNANPRVFEVTEGVVENGQSWTTNVVPLGMAGTNEATLEVSNLPPINLGQRLKYLLQYPYGCLEQTVSSAFPQLYLADVKSLDDGEKTTIQHNVRAAIERIRTFANRDGGFTYWPGAEDVDSWSSTYAGHFLLEAAARGYVVPEELMRRWKKFQRSKAQQWRKRDEKGSSELIQAYRLYTLALAGDAELAAMNRLREQDGLPATSAWMLAASYAKAGQVEAAQLLISRLPTQVNPYQEMDYSYGSDLRDQAVMIETLLLLDERTKAFALVKTISTALSNSNYWMSTQTTAWCLKTVGAYAQGERKGELKFKYIFQGKDKSASTQMSVAQIKLPIAAVNTNTLTVRSETNGPLFVRLIREGVPARGLEESATSELRMEVTYENSEGAPIDVSQLRQGTEFVAKVRITHPGLRQRYDNLALNQVFPSGWEINNLRLQGTEQKLSGDQTTYQDIRDDRVYTYFDLMPGDSKTFKVSLTASFAGEYYLPATTCEAMYDHSIYARKKGQVVKVISGKMQP